MENVSKLGKAQEMPPDRLSCLPEPVLYHILSFLDTKAAVQTSVLSRAWRCAWKHVPVLDLTSPSFQSYSSFVRFADKVLSLRYPLPLRKLTFIDYEFTDHWEDGRLFERVIEYAFSHDARHFVIDLEHELDPEDSLEFSKLFGSVMNSNVETIDLSWVKLDCKSQYSGFGFVTTLNLYCCWLGVLDVFSDSNFPCLKNLVMEECESSYYNGDKVSISGLHLLSLKLLPVPTDDQLEICAPNLKFLSLFNGRPGLTLLSMLNLRLPSLEHVEIRVTSYTECGQDLLSVFQDLHNAKSLKLDSGTIKVLSDISGVLEQQPSPFTRLKYLHFESKHVPHKLVNYFLKGSSDTEPHIELLDEWDYGRRGF